MTGEGEPCSTTPVADLLVIGIHIFRMPVFFVVAGFFTALLVEHRGVSMMFRNRLARVTLPFLLFWVVIAPATLAASGFANGMKAGGMGVDAVVSWCAQGKYWTDNTVHLWFLYYLTLFYAAVFLAAPLVKRVPAGFRWRLSAGFVRVMRSPFRALAFAVPMAVIISFQGGLLRTALSFVPDPLVLLGYAVFFGFGWALWRNQDLIETLPRRAWTQVAIALALAPVNLFAITRLVAGGTAGVGALALASVTGAIVVWLLVFGITGLAIRYAGHERPVMRYLTDASYWMYLIHVPLMLVFPGLLARSPVPALIKLAIVLTVVTLLLLVTYHLLVRNTLIGVLLNGRRYPARLSSLAAPEMSPPS